MKRFLFATALLVAVVISTTTAHAQVVTTSPTSDAISLANHAENLRKTAESMATLNSIYQTMDKTLEYLEKVNSILSTAMEVQEVASSYGRCLQRIQSVSDQIQNMEGVDSGTIASCMTQLTSNSLSCVSLMQRTSNLVSSNVFRMPDADRLSEVRHVLEKFNEVAAKTEMTLYMAKAAKFKTEMSNFYIQ